MKLLRLRQLGDPVLRAKAQLLTSQEILTTPVQELIANIRYTNSQKQYGVGLAAPQVGVSVALSVIGIKPTPTRPNLEPFDSVIINPKYVGIGQKVSLWEGCQSAGRGRSTLYAQVPRYRKVRASWYDETGTLHEEVLESFVAHVFQHETDHLNGIIFVDKVQDTTSYMLAGEYARRIVKV